MNEIFESIIALGEQMYDATCRVTSVNRFGDRIDAAYEAEQDRKMRRAI